MTRLGAKQVAVGRPESNRKTKGQAGRQGERDGISNWCRLRVRVRGLGGYRVEGKLIPFACKGPVQMKKKQRNLPRPFQGNGGGDVEWFFGYPKIWGLRKKRERKRRAVWLLVEFFCLWGNMAGRSCLAAQLLVLLPLPQQRHGRACQG